MGWGRGRASLRAAGAEARENAGPDRSPYHVVVHTLLGTQMRRVHGAEAAQNQNATWSPQVHACCCRAGLCRTAGVRLGARCTCAGALCQLPSAPSVWQCHSLACRMCVLSRPPIGLPCQLQCQPPRLLRLLTRHATKRPAFPSPDISLYSPLLPSSARTACHDVALLLVPPRGPLLRFL